MTQSTELRELQIANNPAGRLFLHLEAAITASASNPIARQVWGQVFGVEANDTRQLLLCISTLMRLTGETREALGRLPKINIDQYERPLGRIDEAFGTHLNLNASWNAFGTQLTKDLMVGLEYIADRLREESDVQTLKSSKLKELLKETEDLRTSVVAAELDDQLKSDLMECLEEMRAAIQQYPLRGNAGLRRATDTCCMVIVRHGPPGPKSPRPSILDAVFSFATKVDGLATRVNKLARLASTVKGLFLEAKD